MNCSRLVQRRPLATCNPSLAPHLLSPDGAINPTGQHHHQPSSSAPSQLNAQRGPLVSQYSSSPLPRTSMPDQGPLRPAGGCSSESSSSSSSSSSSTLHNNNNNYEQTPDVITNPPSSPLPLLPTIAVLDHGEGQPLAMHFDRESVDTGIATQPSHMPFHIQRRLVYMCRFNTLRGYQMEPVIKSRKVIGVLDPMQLINDARWPTHLIHLADNN